MKWRIFSHYLFFIQISVNCARGRNELQRNLNVNTWSFCQKSVFENVVCKLSLILLRPQLVTWLSKLTVHDDVIKWKHFPRYWPFVRGIHRLPVNSPHKGQWRGALLFSLVCACINGAVNTRKAGDVRRHRIHYDVSVMQKLTKISLSLYMASAHRGFWYKYSNAAQC